MKYWVALFIAVLFNVVSNSTLKKAMVETEGDTKYELITTLLFSPMFWVGIITAALLLGFYLFALKGLPVSIAYTSVTSLAMVGLMVSGFFFLNEIVTIKKVVGILLVISGVFVLTAT